MKFSNNCIDLGYTDKELNDAILYGVSHLFSIFNKRKEGFNKHYWIFEYINVITENEKIDLQMHIENIYNEAVGTIQIISNLRTSFQINR